MIRESLERNGKTPKTDKALAKAANRGVATVESALPPGSWQRVAVGVGAAAGGGLLAAALVGVGPAAIAGAAGYLAYRGLTGRKSESRVHKAANEKQH